MIAAMPLRPNLASLAFYALTALVFAGAASLLTWQCFAPGPQLDPPEEVEVFAGVSTDYVRLSWSVVEGASEYRIYRDGKPIDTVTTTFFYDEGANFSGTPAAPMLMAGEDNRNGVLLRWTEPEAPTGVTHSYQVRALNGELRSEQSTPVLGYRAAQPVERFELRVNDGEWISMGRDVSYFDTEAEVVRLQRLRVSASQGELKDFVALDFEGSFPQFGPPSKYQVRAVNAVGPGAASTVAQGRRVLTGADSFQWQRSVGFTADEFEDLPGADSPRFRDVDVAPGHIHYYRLVIGVDGMEPVTTEPVPGWRAEPNGAFVGDPGLEPNQFCNLFLGTTYCGCHSASEADVHRCSAWVEQSSHSQVYLVVSEPDRQRALRIVEHQSFEDGDTHGAESRRLAPDFEVLENSAEVLHMTMTSFYHSFEYMAPEIYDRRTKTTIHAIIDLSGPMLRLLALVDASHREFFLNAEEIQEMRAGAEPLALDRVRDSRVMFARDIGVEEGRAVLRIDDRRFRLGGEPVIFPLRGDGDEPYEAAFRAP